jgi:hypothetical protein
MVFTFCEGEDRLIQASQKLPEPTEIVRSNHTLCALRSAVSLTAGKQTRIPKSAYDRTAPSRFARLLQVGNGAWELITSTGRERALVSGERLAYRDGEIEYFSGDILKRLRSFPNAKRPFFVVPGADPARSIASVTGCDPQPPPRLFISKRHCNVVIIANWGGVPAVMHYADCDYSIAEIERQAGGQGIAASDPEIGHLLSRLLAHKTLANGAAVLAQTRIPADPHQFSWRRIDVVTDLWLSRKPAKNGGKIARLGPRTDKVCEFFPRFRDLLAPPIDALLKWGESAQLPAELAHGDFWLGNILFKGDSLAGIIDWEWARRDGIRMVDVLHMLLFSSAMEHDASFGLYLRRLWSDEIDESELSSRISTVFTQAGMARDDVKFIGLILWFDILWQRAIRGSVHSAGWMEDLIPQTVPVIMRWLNAR